MVMMTSLQTIEVGLEREGRGKVGFRVFKPSRWESVWGEENI
jgi:hypothetical protein